MGAALTTAEIMALSAMVDVPTAGRRFGIGRSLANKLARRGSSRFPCSGVGSRLRVRLAQELVRELGGALIEEINSAN